MQKRLIPLSVLFSPVFKSILIIIWLSLLGTTSAYFSIYVLCGVSALLCMTHASAPVTDKKTQITVTVLSVFFSLAVVLANYDILFSYAADGEMSYTTNTLLNCMNAAFTFAGGICVATVLLNWIYSKYFFAITSPPEGQFAFAIISG